MRSTNKQTGVVEEEPLIFGTLKRENDAVKIPDEQNPYLQSLTKPHIDSFNFMINGGIDRAVADLDPKDVLDSNGNRLQFWIEEVQVGKPTLSEREHHSVNRLIFPSECRERGVTYKGKMQTVFCYKVNDGVETKEVKGIGQLPIMVKSDRCNLEGMTPKQLVSHHEDAEEMGGYFISNGLERLIRLLIVQRRNYAMALIRPSFAKRGPLYTQFGTAIRCVREDQSSQTITVHYLSDGDITLRFSIRKREYMIPAVLILKALVNTNDKEIFEKISQGANNSFVTERVEVMLRNQKQYQVYTQQQILTFLGGKFQSALGLSDSLTDYEVGQYLLKKVLFVHLQKNSDKFELLIYMIQKLLSLVAGDCLPDNPDSPMNQEVLLPGHFFLMYLKEKLEEWLSSIKINILADLRRNKTIDFMDNTYFKKVVSRVPSDVGKKMEYLLATGNAVTNTGMDLQQTTGYSIIAEKLNFFRYISHFRSIHRGAFFAEIRTTTVRKLLPESWGFFCPAHTPDGAPCGLLNHLTHTCQVVNNIPDAATLPSVLSSLGMSPLIHGAPPFPPNYLPVFLDGLLIGKAKAETLGKISVKLRYMKINEMNGIPPELEIGYVPPSNGGQYPGLFLFSTPARMMRPVKHLQTGKTEMIGSFEQVYMDIACNESEIIQDITTHIEILPTNILSVVANLTPFCDFNQSPRNMYQCQMGKQSMGTPTHSFPHRTDNKMYRLMTGQSPIVRPKLFNTYGMDNYPNGANAVVAVISYTGYDMEDAMILNKSSFERGFGNGTVYQSKPVDLTVYRKKGEPESYFGIKDKRDVQGKLDSDGLPYVGARLTEGDPLYCVIDGTTGQARIEKYKGELAYVEEVRIIGDDTGESTMQKVNIKLRVPRPPIIGDKFSSRHGQKGVCSQKWPQVDMPFTESGMTPDVIINPHAFPSRMTIGMLIESMAGKAGAIHGICQDATAFKFNERHSAIDYFGEQLIKAGYNYYGNEPMYSGTVGCELRADIYFGVVYYQRLRHMVSDKYQVRTTGPVHNLTQQPVKGRKRAGGIRLGEMERDSLLGHGVSFILQDRLMNCSDFSYTHVCELCGSILSPISTCLSAISTKRETNCKYCETSKGIRTIQIPYVFRYLVSELLSMNIRLTLHVK